MKRVKYLLKVSILKLRVLGVVPADLASQTEQGGARTDNT